MEQLDCVVIGAGVVGLAVARQLARLGREVLILEAREAFGTVTSARNSEVIHAGIYYRPGSLKARLCVEGRGLLYDYCAERGVAHRRVGKLLVATHPSQHEQLAALECQARANGVGDLQRLSAAAARALEPALQCSAALLSPSTGIIDSHALMLALLGDAQAGGATLVLRSPVLALRALGTGGAGVELVVGGDQAISVRARSVVNAAGLSAPALAQRFAELPAHARPSGYFCKGSYFSCSGKPPFRHLIYPMPDAAGLGVHITLDLAGQMRFGPDTEWIGPELMAEDAHGLPDLDPWYGVQAARQAGMAAAIRRYWPTLPDDALTPAYAGIRPKINGPQEGAADFRIDGSAQHGVAGLVNLFGIESPGLTASLAIARYVAEVL